MNNFMDIHVNSCCRHRHLMMSANSRLFSFKPSGIVERTRFNNGQYWKSS